MNSTTQNETHLGFWIQESRSVKIARLTVMSTIALCGVLGNVLVFVVLLKRKPFRETLRSFIFHLAISDTGFLLINYPLAVVMEQHLPAWTLGRMMCRFGAPASDTFLGVAILSITAIALDRLRCVTIYEVTLEKLAVFYKHGLKLILLVIWFIAFLSFAFPWILIKRYESRNDNGTFHGYRCLAIWPDSISESGKVGQSSTAKAYSMFLLIAFYAIPILLISFTYWKIARHIRKINICLTQNNSYRSRGLENRLSANTKAKKILTPLVMVFATTMFSINVFRAVLSFRRDVFFVNCYLILYNVCVFSTVLNSALDPIIYAVYSREFRREVKIVVSSLLPARINEAIEMKRRNRRIHPVLRQDRP